MTEFYRGEVLRIVFVGDLADSSFKRLEGRFGGQRKVARLLARIKRLADHGRLRSPDQMNRESFQGKPSKIYAVKTSDGLRAYGFYCTREEGHEQIRQFCVTEFIVKKRDGLKKKHYENAMRIREEYLS